MHLMVLWLALSLSCGSCDTVTLSNSGINRREADVERRYVLLGLSMLLDFLLHCNMQCLGL